METTIEVLIYKYNDHKHLIEQNEKLINDYNVDLKDIEEAIEIIEKNGGLLDQIKKYDEQLESIASNYQLRNEDSINVFDIINNRKKIENKKDELVKIKEFLEENNISDLNSKEEALMVLNKNKDNIISEIELCETKKNNSLLIIQNIGEIYKERLEEVESKNVDRTQKIQFAETKINPLIEQMKQIEIELKKYELFRNEGVLTHAQTVEVNRLMNNAKEITKDFLEKLGQNTSLAEIINSADMTNLYYNPYMSQLSNQEQNIEYSEKTKELSALINEVEQYLNGDSKEHSVEEEKIVEEETKKTEETEMETPEIDVEMIPETEYKEPTNENKTIVDVEPNELKSIETPEKDSLDTLINNIESMETSNPQENNEQLNEINNNENAEDKKLDKTDEFLYYFGKSKVNDEENNNNIEIDNLESPSNEIPNEELSNELFGTTNQTELDFGINDNQSQEQHISNPQEDELLKKILEEIVSNEKNTLSSTIKKPFSMIVRKIKRKKSASEIYKDKKDASLTLSQEINVNQNENNRQR